MIEWWTTTPAHVDELMTRLRPRDAVLAECPEVVHKAVAESLISQTCLYRGQVGGIYGVNGTVVSDKVMLWMLGSTLIDEHPLTFLRTSRRLLARLRDRYAELHGLVWSDFDESRRWLEWLGAELRPVDEKVMAWVQK